MGALTPTPPPKMELQGAHGERHPLLPTVCDDVAVNPLDLAKSASSSSLSALKETPHELLGLGLVAVSAVCFSIVTTLVKYETMNGLTFMETIFWRSSIAFVLNGVCMLRHGISPYVPPSHRNAMLLQCLFGFCCIGFAFFAISRMVLADASVLIFTSPVLTFFLGACVLREHIDPVSLGCALFSGVGTICVLRPAMLFGEAGDDEIRAPTIGVVAALLAAVTQALLYVFVRKLQVIHPLVVAHYFALFSALAAMCFVLIFESHVTWPSTTGLQLAAIGTGVFAFIGQAALTKGFQLESAGIAAVMRYLDVVCVFIWDSTWLHEPVSPWSAVGAIIVCACALGIALRKARIL